MSLVFLFGQATAVCQFCLHILVILLADGIEVQGYHTDAEEDGRYNA